MADFCDEIRTLLNDVTHWIIADPAFADVEFPEKVSKDYLIHGSRVGKYMVWVDEDRGTQKEQQPMGGSLMAGRFIVFCYARAKSSADAEIKAAQTRAAAMRAQASTIIKDHWNTLPGAFVMRPLDTDNWEEQGVEPWFFVKTLGIEIDYEI